MGDVPQSTGQICLYTSAHSGVFFMRFFFATNTVICWASVCTLSPMASWERLTPRQQTLIGHHLHAHVSKMHAATPFYDHRVHAQESDMLAPLQAR